MVAHTGVDGYTGRDMQQFLNNRYVRLTGLTVGIAALLYSLIWIVLITVGLEDFPQFLQISLSVLGASVLVYKFFSQRIA